MREMGGILPPIEQLVKIKQQAEQMIVAARRVVASVKATLAEKDALHKLLFIISGSVVPCQTH